MTTFYSVVRQDQRCYTTLGDHARTLTRAGHRERFDTRAGLENHGFSLAGATTQRVMVTLSVQP